MFGVLLCFCTTSINADSVSSTRVPGLRPFREALGDIVREGGGVLELTGNVADVDGAIP
jgi:hypothetical protein